MIKNTENKFAFRHKANCMYYEFKLANSIFSFIRRCLPGQENCELRSDDQPHQVLKANVELYVS